MSVQIAVRLAEEDVLLLDQAVAQGEAKNRSDAVRAVIAHRRRALRYEEEGKIMAALAARGEAVYPGAADFVAAQDLSRLG
ncbi:MAG: ribbon-helix-helix domain-containing protein [Bifidobacteriaceae bacterium]|jgi:Arc/MetJ-type ribon-helix-helix transcriptional regulator|nr:ribbon-helix-helix domain-containing protein [Bifidobacteriaceae bacterium]